MFGTFCCTFIPNGSITKALEGLMETAGTEHPFSSVLERRFENRVVLSPPCSSLLQWQQLFSSLHQRTDAKTD